MADTIKIGNLDISSFKVGTNDCKIYLGTTKLYPNETPSHDYSQDYLTFIPTAPTKFKYTDTSYKNKLYYSVNGGSSWSSLSRGSYSITFTAGQKVMWKGTCQPYINGGLYKGICQFSSSGGTFSVEGNVMSLLFSDNFIGQTSLNAYLGAFVQLFYACASLINIDNIVLPATTLDVNCYTNMFNSCTSLTSVPSNLLPATTLSYSCYSSMFKGCTSLTKAPELPATTLVGDCYYGMFAGCSSLNYIKCLATDISASNCTGNWVNGVASSGTFVKDASMTNWTTGNDGIPSNWAVTDNT